MGKQERLWALSPKESQLRGCNEVAGGVGLGAAVAGPLWMDPSF